MLFDTHTHLQFSAFDPSASLRAGDNLDEVIRKSRESGVEKMVVVGTDINSSKKAIEIATSNQNVFASIGIHPHHIFEHLQNEIASSKTPRNDVIASGAWRSLDQDLFRIEKLLLENEKVVAIGETGMDRHHYSETRHMTYEISDKFIELQKYAFQKQIKLALTHQKSLIIHNREAVSDLLDVLDVHLGGVQSLAGRAVFHMCEPDQRLLDFAKKNRVYIGVGGDVTYDKAKQEFVKKIPLDLLVLETDSPFLVPKGFKFPNTPDNLYYIAEFIAKILEIDVEKLKEVTYKNSKLFFKL